MALMLSKTYNALKEAGASESAAREASEEVAGLEYRLATIESDVRVLKWMVGFMLGMQVGTLALLFQIALRMGAMP